MSQMLFLFVFFVCFFCLILFLFYFYFYFSIRKRAPFQKFPPRACFILFVHITFLFWFLPPCTSESVRA
jgi:hypothetical protein